MTLPIFYSGTPNLNSTIKTFVFLALSARTKCAHFGNAGHATTNVHRLNKIPSRQTSIKKKKKTYSWIISLGFWGSDKLWLLIGLAFRGDGGVEGEASHRVHRYGFFGHIVSSNSKKSHVHTNSPGRIRRLGEKNPRPGQRNYYSDRLYRVHRPRIDPASEKKNPPYNYKRGKKK